MVHAVGPEITMIYIVMICHESYRARYILQHWERKRAGFEMIFANGIFLPSDMALTSPGRKRVGICHANRSWI